MSRLCILALSFTVAGCATSRLTAFRDPAYADARFAKIAVFALGMTLESAVQVERQVCQKLAPAAGQIFKVGDTWTIRYTLNGRRIKEAVGPRRQDAVERLNRRLGEAAEGRLACVEGKSVVPPTRHDSAEVDRLLGGAGVDGVLVVMLVADQSGTNYLGTVTTSSAGYGGTTRGSLNLYGNTGFWNSTTQGYASAQSVSTPMYAYSRVAFAQVGLFERSNGNIAWHGELKVSGKGAVNITDGAFIKSATSKIAAQLKLAGLLR